MAHDMVPGHEPLFAEDVDCFASDMCPFEYGSSRSSRSGM